MIPRTAVYHYIPKGGTLQEGNIILMEWGQNINGNKELLLWNCSGFYRNRKDNICWCFLARCTMMVLTFGNG
jgi:hypothetical protein